MRCSVAVDATFHARQEVALDATLDSTVVAISATAPMDL